MTTDDQCPDYLPDAWGGYLYGGTPEGFGDPIEDTGPTAEEDDAAYDLACEKRAADEAAHPGLQAELAQIERERIAAVRAKFAETYDPTRPVPCQDCGRDMRQAVGCEPSLSYPYGQEPDWLDYAAVERVNGRPCEPLDNCRNCNAPLGTYHHHACTQAYCWTCDEQFMLCDHGPHGDDDYAEEVWEHLAQWASDARALAIERLAKRARDDAP